MDKPRHPLVTRPWKIQQTQRTKCNLETYRRPKREKSTGVSIRNRQRSFILRKPASRVPRSRFETDTFSNHDNGSKDVRTNALEFLLEFFGLTPLRARE